MMDEKGFTGQLFNALNAINLRQAAALRPLSAKEKSGLEHCEAKAGPLLADLQARIEAEKARPRA